MSFSEIPPPLEVDPGQDEPKIVSRPPGPASRSWLVRHAHRAAPMGPKQRNKPGDLRAPPSGIVYASAKGSNVIDVDSNRYVDLAAGFGAMLLGHSHPNVLRVLEFQAQRLLLALGDVFPADAKIALCERLAQLHPDPSARVILGQSGADAVTAALKSALLYTNKPGVLAFSGAYHGLSHAPLAACGLRESYREPFAAQLNPHVTFVDYPSRDGDLDSVLTHARSALVAAPVGAILVEPILGRGGVLVPPSEFLPELGKLAREFGALVIADEIWTGLGRSGKLVFSARSDFTPDLVCLGKGLGGGLPMSAVVGRGEVLQAWQRDAEVVHTSTFAGSALACATSLATLDVLSREHLPERAAQVGTRFLRLLETRLARFPKLVTRGSGLMVAIDLGLGPDRASLLASRLLERGYITSTGGGRREVLVLTPPLTLSESLLDGFCDALESSIGVLGS
ncbi:MAG TPA: aspartate aminotransferase family protein [Polyangiaceae bacterium]|jgi:4-aminobutyrate aminotransferase/(S)-3-amino-2-methylpropionate transaminase|nr:aspartate aminotransferase family protein [Polyangiaceae bacterium]